MRTPTPHAPGWYPDHEDASRVRYWDGQGWTGRLRPRPVWAPLETQVIRLAPPPPVRRRPGLRDRATAVLAVVIVGALVVGTILVGQGRSVVGPSRTGPNSVSGRRFLEAANAICAAVRHSEGGRDSSLPKRAPAAGSGGRTTRAATPAGSRRPATGGQGGATTQGETTTLQAATTGASPSRVQAARLAKESVSINDALHTTSARPPADPSIEKWLQEWTVMAFTSAEYARAVRHGRPSASVVSAARSARDSIDSFAEAHGLDHCRL